MSESIASKHGPQEAGFCKTLAFPRDQTKTPRLQNPTANTSALTSSSKKQTRSPKQSSTPVPTSPPPHSSSSPATPPNPNTDLHQHQLHLLTNPWEILTRTPCPHSFVYASWTTEQQRQRLESLREMFEGWEQRNREEIRERKEKAEMKPAAGVFDPGACRRRKPRERVERALRSRKGGGGI